MSKNRQMLDEELLEGVIGGSIYFVNYNGEKYLYGTHSSDVKYGFAKTSVIRSFVASHYDEYGERGTIQLMLEQGLIWPL